MRREAVAAFLDTMIYLHFRPIDEIDWLGLLNADRVHLVVPRITIRELDYQKNLNRSSRLRERARRVLTTLEACFVRSAAELRPNVFVERWTEPSGMDLSALGLRPDWNDDVLIAAIVAFREADSSRFPILVTQDSGPRLTAQEVGIMTTALADELRLADDPDPLERENRELLRRLQRVENAMPKLGVSFVASTGTRLVDGRLEVRLTEQGTDLATAIRQALERAEAAVPKRSPAPPSPVVNLGDGRGKTAHDLSTLARLAASAAWIRPIRAEEFERYDSERDKYLARVQLHAKQCWLAEAERRRSFTVAISIQNTGTCPAQDVDVHLHVPDGPMVSRDKPSQNPEAPEPPEEPLSDVERLTRNMASYSHVGLASFPITTRRDFGPPPNVSDFTIKKSDSFDVDAHVGRIKHGGSEKLRKLYFTFPSLADATSFGVRVTIRAANLPDAIEDELHVVVIT